MSKNLLMTIALAAACIVPAEAKVDLNLSRTIKVGAEVKAKLTKFGSSDLQSLKKVAADEGTGEGEGEGETEPAPEETWKVLGEGTWAENFLTDYEDIDIEPGEKWAVTIEESETTPGLYRMLPYNENSPLYAILGNLADTENYFYVNATNPDTVFCDTDFTPYGSFLFSHMVPESGWEESTEGQYDANYGTLVDGVISFPARAFAEDYYGQWYYVNIEGQFKIGLPGAKITDYRIATTAEICDPESVTISTLGADVASIAYLQTDGYTEIDETNIEAILTAATTISATGATTLPVDDTTPGMKTMCAFTFDGDGNVQLSATSVYFISEKGESSSEWKLREDIEAEFSEFIICGLFEGIDSEVLTCAVEESTVTPNVFRLKNPYENYYLASSLATDCEHDHYIIINASNSEAVTIEPSVLGLDASYGNMWLWSEFGYYTSMGFDPEILAMIGIEAGTMTDNVITFPDGSLFISMPDYGNGSFLYAGLNTSIEFKQKEVDSIKEITSAEAGESAIYDLQGRKLSVPTRGINIINGKKTIVR